MKSGSAEQFCFFLVRIIAPKLVRVAQYHRHSRCYVCTFGARRGAGGRSS